MSSSPPSEPTSPAAASPPASTPATTPAARRSRFAGWSLRKRLLAGILGLFAVVCLLIGVTSTLAMRQYLIHQLDTQLASASQRASFGGGTPPRHDPGQAGAGADQIFAPGQSVGTVRGTVAQDGTVDLRVVTFASGRYPYEQLTADEVTAIPDVPADGKAHTVSLGSRGNYRLSASPTPDGTVVLTGLPMTELQDAVWQLVGIEVGVALAGLLIAALASAAIVRLSLRPLSRVAATAALVAELPLSEGDVDLSVRVPDEDTDPRTEVGRVGSALNRMLGHVGDALAIRHASEMRVRQFVADASHELRTPLAAIRGYAELTRRGRDTVPPDIAHALGRVESESARMTTLVDDLLLLARLDSGRPLDRDPVELSRLVVDTVNDAHAAGREHRWLLNLPDEAVTVPGDTARLHQVLANLLANARTHTPPGTIVTTSLAVHGDRAVISVTDNGPGIPGPLLPDIFERFARGDSSRSRAAGSTGLGLAIVAAVVEAHQGRVEVMSHAGHTSFVVSLPDAERA